MTGSPNIKTPAMDVPLLSLPDAKEKGDNLKKYFSRVLLKDVRRSEEGEREERGSERKGDVWEKVVVKKNDSKISFELRFWRYCYSQKPPNFPFGPWTIVHGHQKI